tara:strand:- start:107 stop:355 length:249 start_codon:yes stop_codon:yes gene_type:complete
MFTYLSKTNQLKTYIMRAITVTMTDNFTGETINRDIDITNAMINNIIGTDAQITENLNQWINHRANQQHETLLTLISYKLIK